MWLRNFQKQVHLNSIWKTHAGLNYFYDSASTQVFCLFFYFKKFFIRPHHEVNIQRVNKITSKSLPKLRNVNVNIATFEGALLLLPLFSIKTLLKLFKSQHSTPLIQLYSAWLDIEIRKLPSTYKFVWGRGKVRPHNLFYYDSEK